VLAVTAHLNLWLQLAAATVIILVGARTLTRAVDAISIRTGIGHSLVGVILLATATSLPELGTGISAIRIHQPDLAMGSVYGSNLFNLLLIAIIDIAWRRGPILAMCGRPARWIAWLGIGIITLGTVAVLWRDSLPSTTILRVAPMTWGIVAFFFLAMWILYKRTAAGDEDKEEITDRTMTLARAVSVYLASAGVVIVGAVWLARVGDAMATAYGWQASFVGTQFLALCTSLPELATSLAALQIGAPALAISNVLGSNLFNMGIVVYCNDLAFGGSIWPAVAGIHALTGSVAILMTVVVIVAMQQRKPRALDTSMAAPSPGDGSRAGYEEALLLMVIYLITSVVVFRVG
jgi:cation:H+ antiporter